MATLSLFLITMNMTAQTIKLPEPVKTGGMPLSEAIANRHSVREYDTEKTLDRQQLSDMLWSAVGINRPESGMRSNPTAMNSQEIDVYVFDKEGVYLYDPKANELVKKADGDHRALVAGTAAFSQDFVLDAPVSLVMIADLGRFENKGPAINLCAALDAGIVSENVNLFCSANGLATVPRLTMDAEGIKKLLGMSDNHLPLINNPVGFAK